MLANPSQQKVGVRIANNKSASFQDVITSSATSDMKETSSPSPVGLARHFSQEVITGNKPIIKYEINKEMLLSARKNMDTGKHQHQSVLDDGKNQHETETNNGKNQPILDGGKQQQHQSVPKQRPTRSLPPTPSKSSSSPASSPSPFPSPASGSNPPSSSSPSSPSPSSSIATSDSPEAIESTPPSQLKTRIAITSESNSESDGPLSPTVQSRRPLPATPLHVRKAMLARATTSPDMKSSPESSGSPIQPSPLSKTTTESLSNARASSSSSIEVATNKSSSSPSVEPPYLNDVKKAKYYSTPEVAVAMKEGLCQRHLSAPSTVLSESQLMNASADTQFENDLVPLNSSSSSLTSSQTDSPGIHRSWYLKKSSTHTRVRSMTPKEQKEIRTQRKNLPSMIEVTSKDKVIAEIIATEATYVDDLNVVVKVFIDLMKKFNALSEADMSAIFSNVEELYEINKSLLTDLVAIIPNINEMAGDSFDCPPIGDVFVRHLPKLSGYTTYLCNKDLSSRVVKKVGNVYGFGLAIELCKEHPESNNLGLGDYLIKPVQRLCKYPLLFKELVKQLKPEDPQLPVLNRVTSEIEAIAEITNKTITNTEKLNQMMKIMGADISPLIEGSTMIRDGVIHKVIKGSKKEEMFFWILDKIIMWHPTKATLRKRKQDKDNFILVFSISSLSDTELDNLKHSFCLLYKNEKGKEKKLVFCAKSYLEKLCWVEDIRAQMDKLT